MADTHIKAEKLRIKTELVAREFNLGAGENVMQDYYCSFGAVGRPGRLYVTANYLLWLPATVLQSASVKLPFRRIAEIRPDKSALVLNNAITVTAHTPEETFFFCSLQHRDETLALLLYMWKHPVTVLEPEEEAPRIGSAASGAGTGSLGGKSSYGIDRASLLQEQSSDDGPAHFSSSGGEVVQAKIKVDTESSRNALRVARQAREIGMSVTNELSAQHEQMDRIEDNLDHIDANLVTSDRLLRGIASVGGAAKNVFSTENSLPAARTLRDHTIDFKKPERPSLEHDVLEKAPKSDLLISRVMRFAEEKFMVLDPKTGKPEKGKIWSYTQVRKCVLRARHHHLDIIFIDANKYPIGQGRYRLCSSYLQSIVNEMSLRWAEQVSAGAGASDTRSSPASFPVEFEEGTVQFKFGYASLSVGSEHRSTCEELMSGGPGSVGRVFGRRPNEASITKTLLKNVDEETKAGLLQQEDDLDEISDVVGDLNMIANAIGDELDAQEETLGRITDKTERTDAHIKRNNAKMQRILDN